MRSFNIGDTVKVKNLGQTYQHYSRAYIALGFRNTTECIPPNIDYTKALFKVTGIFQHEYSRSTFVLGIEYKDIQIAIGQAGCTLYRVLKLNNNIKVL
jgi:hypothetical protein